MTRTPILPLVALAVLLTAAPSKAAGQRVNTVKPTAPAASVTLDGIVYDAIGRPLSAAEIIVSDDKRAISNARGEFRIPDLPAGIVEFTARRIGYQPTTTAIQVDPGLTVHLAVKLVPVPVQLGTIVIEGKTLDKTLWQTGFYQRRDGARGHFFDAEFFKSFHASLGAVMENVAAVRVARGTGGRGRAIPMGVLPTGATCPLNVFVDGNFIPWATETGIDDVVNRDDVLAMEVYPRASELPPTIAGRGGMTGTGSLGTVKIAGQSVQVGGGFAECGAILVWTRPLGDKAK